MTGRDNKNRTWLVVSLGVIVVALVIGANSIYRIEQRRQLGDVHALIDEGIAQFRAEQYELSAQTLGSIPEDLIEDWHIPYYLGSALIQLKDYEKGAARLEEALALNPTDKNALFALGVAYYKLGNLSLSKAYFASVLEIDPSHEEAKGLMDIMASLERYQTEGDGEQDTVEGVAADVDR
jgi:tetratricopeptide (TPR) repeat protein